MDTHETEILARLDAIARRQRGLALGQALLSLFAIAWLLDLNGAFPWRRHFRVGTGNDRVIMGQRGDDALIAIGADSESPKASLSVIHGNSMLSLGARDGQEELIVGPTNSGWAALSMYDHEGKLRLLLGIDPDGDGALKFLDADGQVTWSAP